MSSLETTSYHCDKCGKKLKTCDNSMTIRTELGNPESQCLSRIDVQIVYKHGMHNEGEEAQADLCKTCAVELLTDALKRVRSGERASAGVEDSEQGKWARA